MAATPEGLIEEWDTALQRGDVEGLAACYEDDATFLVDGMGIVAEGLPAIRDAYTGLVAAMSGPSLEVTSRVITMAGDYAFTHFTGILRAKDNATQEAVEMPARATEVMHRGPDGKWRYVIDHAV